MMSDAPACSNANADVTRQLFKGDENAEQCTDTGGRSGAGKLQPKLRTAGENVSRRSFLQTQGIDRADMSSGDVYQIAKVNL